MLITWEGVSGISLCHFLNIRTTNRAMETLKLTLCCHLVSTVGYHLHDYFCLCWLILSHLMSFSPLSELEDYVDRLQRRSASSPDQLSITLRDVEEGAVNLRRVGETLAVLKGWWIWVVSRQDWIKQYLYLIRSMIKTLDVNGIMNESDVHVSLGNLRLLFFCVYKSQDSWWLWLTAASGHLWLTISIFPIESECM